jgi:hypothetical protein
VVIVAWLSAHAGKVTASAATKATQGTMQDRR